MRRYLIPVLVVLVSGAFVMWWFSTSQVLKRRTSSLLETMTIEADSGMAGRQMKTYSLNRLLADSVKMETSEIEAASGTFERNELESGFSWLANQAKETRFEVEDFETIEVDGETAKVVLTLTGLVDLKSYRPVDGKYDVVLDWRKEGDGWRLTGSSWNPAR
jgi:hypothetical protein